MKGTFQKAHINQLAGSYDGYVLVPVDSACVNIVSKIDGFFEVDVSNAMLLTRSKAQQAAIEVYSRLLAKALNDAGLDMHTVLAHREIPWSQHTVKEEIWKKAQEPLLGISSTTQLAPNQVSQVYDVVNNFISTKFGVSVPFPSRDNKNGT